MGYLSRLRRLGLACAVLGLVGSSFSVSTAGAAGPPSPPPYSKIGVRGSNEPAIDCRDSDNTLLYHGPMWTLEPLIRGPEFAPVVLWLEDAGNVPVVPLEFDASGFPILWQTADGGPSESGLLESFGGRPVGYGSTPTDPKPRVTCGYGELGHIDYGTFTITAGLAEILELPVRLIGRTLNFENEGAVTFTLPRSIFPLTATTKAPTLPTPDYLLYGKRSLPTVTCVDGATTVYNGAAYTLAPLTRGYQWAPMALWLDDDRIVTPRWFTSSVQGTWRTVSGTPARSGTLSASQAGRPVGYGTRPPNATSGVDCSWGGQHNSTRTVSAALAAQLNLPTDLIGRRVELSGTYTIHASSPTWLFPPL